MGQINIGVNNIARNVKNVFIGVDGVARAVKNIYIGDANGKARQVWSASTIGDIMFGKNQSDTNGTLFVYSNGSVVRKTSLTNTIYSLVGYKDVIITNCDGRIYYSIDKGNAFNLISLSNPYCRGISYSPYQNRYLITTMNSTAGVYYSTDGSTWNPSMSGVNANLCCQSTDNNCICLACIDSTYTYSSLMTYTNIGGSVISSGYVGEQTFTDMVYANGYFYALTSSGNIYKASSSNNMGVTLILASNYFNSLCYANGIFYANKGKDIYSSSDCITFTQIGSVISDYANGYSKLKYADGVFHILVNGAYYTSTNAINWIKKVNVDYYASIISVP